MMRREDKNQFMVIANFIIVDSLTFYNAILGRLFLNTLKYMVSTYNIEVKSCIRRVKNTIKEHVN